MHTLDARMYNTYVYNHVKTAVQFHCRPLAVVQQCNTSYEKTIGLDTYVELVSLQPDYVVWLVRLVSAAYDSFKFICSLFVPR